MGKLHPLRDGYSDSNTISRNKHKVVPTFNLVNHDKELAEAEVAIEELKNKVNDCLSKKTICDNVHLALYEEIIRVLDYAGRLSMQVFEVNEELELQYIQKYKKQPALAKQLWLEHYDQLHHPYSLIKNRCFKLLDKLDQGYIDTFKHFPPNWNP